jgi:hypothetical protein
MEITTGDGVINQLKQFFQGGVSGVGRLHQIVRLSERTLTMKTLKIVCLLKILSCI